MQTDDAADLRAERERLRARLAEIDRALPAEGGGDRGDDRWFRALFDSAFHLAALLDPSGRLIEVNRTVIEAIGAQGVGPMGTPWWEAPGWCGPEEVEAARRAAVEAGVGRRATFPARIRTPAGAVLAVECSVRPVLGDGDAVLAVLVEARDVTAQRASAEAAAASESRLHGVLSEIEDVVCSFDLDRPRFTYVSPSAQRVLGVPAEEIVAREGGFLELVHADDLPRLAEARRLVLAEGAGELEHRVVRPDGAERWVRTRMHLVRGPDGAPLRADAILTDVTERRLAEAALTASRDALARMTAELERRVAERTAELSLANAALARASRAKDEFLASMSHELRTPLNAVLGLCEALDDEVYGPVAEAQRRALGRITDSGRHLLELISDILDLSKIEAGRLSLDVSPVSANDVCRASLTMIQEAAQRKRQTVSVQIQDGFLTVPADERRLRQILVNLLSNAVKFTPEGGSIGLSVGADESGDGVRFTVTDSGMGISREDQARLFQPFVQLDASLSRQHTGTGLGLSLVRRLVELHGGCVTVDSEPGKGSRFSAVLPRRRALGTPEQKPPVEVGPRALIVEDSRPVAEQLARYVREVGMVPVIHDNSHGVVERAAAEKPQVILLDILLPAEVGWDILRELKADPRTAHIPVVVVSVLERPEKGVGLGADGYLVKPVSRERLHAVLSAVTAEGHGQPVLIVAPQAGASPLRRILLAEDDETNVATVIDFLRSRDYEVFVARNGKEAVRLAREVRPDLVLMDIQMPVMDGFQATEAIRADPSPAIAATPIVAVTALAMTGDRERCLAAGANEYLTKPVGLKRLATVIERLVSPR